MELSYIITAPVSETETHEALKRLLDYSARDLEQDENSPIKIRALVLMGDAAELAASDDLGGYKPLAERLKCQMYLCGQAARNNHISTEQAQAHGLILTGHTEIVSMMANGGNHKSVIW